MPGAPIHTWKDLLLPDEQDIRVNLNVVAEGQDTAEDSSFSLPAWNPERLPSFAHLSKDLPSKIHDHLGVILDHHFSDQAARTSLLEENIGNTITPRRALGLIRVWCTDWEFNLSHERATRSVAEPLLYLVNVAYSALTGKNLFVQGGERSSHSFVITDRVFKVDDEVKILWAEKSSRAFDRFIGELMEHLRDRSTIELCVEPVATTYHGYMAILGELGYHASDIHPRVRWAIVFSGLRYVIFYIPRRPGRPQMYCSPVMRFCTRPDDEQEPAIQPPIWSVLLYMLLVETLNIDDDVLRQKFGLVAPMEDPDLGLKIDTQGRSGRAMEVDEILSQSGKVAERITVQCLDAYSMELSLVNASDSHANEQYHPFIHLDRHLGAGWSSVFASSKSHVVVKFAVVPKKDKAELIRQLGNEKLAYTKLSCITGWAVPRLYGEYEWHGGRALVISDEGEALSHVEKFASLPLIERLILFAELCCIHYLGVEHADFEPKNVLRKGSSHFLKIIDFGFSDAEHTCPGWRCGELEEAWHGLQLDGMNFRFGLLSMVVFPFLAFVIISVIPANWRLWTQMN